MVNLVQNDKPSDIYSIIANRIFDELNEMFDNMTLEEVEVEALEVARKSVPEARWGHFLNAIHRPTDEFKKAVNAYYRHIELYNWFRLSVKRKDVKRSVMTYLYSSKEYGFADQIREDKTNPLMKYLDAHQPDWRSGTYEERLELGFPFYDRGQHAARALANLIYKHISTTAVKASEVMDWLTTCGSVIAKEGRAVHVTSPLGFPFVQDYKVQTENITTIKVAGAKYQLTISSETDKCDSRKSSSALSPNTTHMLDASLIWLVVYNAAMEGMADFALIHDSMATYAADTNRFFQLIRETLVQLFSETDVFENIRQDFLSQLPEDKHHLIPELPEYGDFDLSNILEAQHAFS